MKIILFLVSINIVLFADNRKKIDSINALPYEAIVYNLDKSIKLYNENVKLAGASGYKEGLGKSYAKLAKAYYLNGKYDLSAENYLKAIKILEEVNDINELSETLGEFGYQLKRTNLDKANYYMRQGINVAVKNNLDYQLAKLYDNYGVIKEMENNIDSASFYYKKSLSLKYSFKDTIGIPYSLNKLAGVALINNDFDTAFDYLKKSDEYRNKEEGDFGRIENLVMYGDLYSKMGNYKKAIYYFTLSSEQAKKSGVNYIIQYSYEQLTDLSVKSGDYKNAYENLILLTAYKDSLLNQEIRLKVAELELDYETEKKDRQIAQSKLELNEKTTQIYFLISIALIVVSVSILIHNTHKRKREAEKKEFELNSKIQQAELENKIAEDKLRISRELHDSIGSQLTFIISSLDNYSYQLKNISEIERLEKLSKFGRDTLKELRNTIWALKHENSDLDNLILKINELIKVLNDNGQLNIEVSSNINKEIKLSAMQMLNIYRIIQEATQNTIKYAQAHTVQIKFVESQTGFDFEISDDGKGFDMDRVAANNGLENMKYRCEESNGIFSIESSSNGTRILCKL